MVMMIYNDLGHFGIPGLRFLWGFVIVVISIIGILTSANRYVRDDGEARIEFNEIGNHASPLDVVIWHVILVGLAFLCIQLYERRAEYLR